MMTNIEENTASEGYITVEKIDDRRLQQILNRQDGAGRGACRSDEGQDYISGSLLLFAGIVRRDKTDRGFVKEIIYETYQEMAEKEIDKIRKEAMEKSGAEEICIKHRIGKVAVGEISLLVAVLTPHRKEGIETVDYIIDRIKQTVPIWKKEIFEDGSYRWVEGHDG